MIQDNGNPFIFRDLKGTNWYRRFIAEEYYIMLDQYPDKMIIEDKELEGMINSQDSRLSRYKEHIIEFFLSADDMLDQRSYWDVLLSLRRFKSDLFNEINFADHQKTDPSAPLEGFSHTLGSWIETVKENMLIKNHSNKVWIQPEMEEYICRSKKCLFIPGKPQFLKTDLISWVKPLIGTRRIELLCFDDPLYRSVTKQFAAEALKELRIDSIELISFSQKNMGIERFQEYSKDGGLILTTGIWPFLALFKDISSLAFSIDNSEWCSNALFDYSFDASKKYNPIIETDNYNNILTKTVSATGISIAAFQTNSFRESTDFSGVQYSSATIFDHVTGNRALTFPERIEKNREWLSTHEHLAEIEHIFSFFKLIEGKSVKCDKEDTEAVFISSVILEERVCVVKPLLFDAMIDINDLNISGAGFLSSFNYYYTSNLVKLYNRQVPSNQQLNIENFFIDYLGFFTDTSCFESLPLYHKAYIGCTADGSLFSGHYTVNSIDITIDGRILHFDDTTINPDDPNSRYGLYLPSYGKETVGAGRFCLVIIQDQIIFRENGPCRIPPAGAVIVLGEVTPISSKTLGISVEFSDLPVEKEYLKWMVGGFNLLVEDGVNCYETPDKSIESLRKEGWLSSQSKQTQETELNPMKRQPRCVFGKTSHNRLILAVFSGRTDLSCGVRFSESIMYTMSFLHDGEKLDFLINFDGGASASLIAYDNRVFKNLSLTAPSIVNPVGVPRRLNAYFSINLKEKAGSTQ